MPTQRPHRRLRRKSVKEYRTLIERPLFNRVALIALVVLIVFAGVIGARDAYDNPKFVLTLGIDLGNKKDGITFDNFIAEAFGYEGDEGNESSSTGASSKEPASKDPDGTSSDNDSDIITLSGETKWDHFRHIIKDALKFYDLDDRWTNTILAMIRTESNGNVYIDNYQDILQTVEGDGKSILMNGVREKGVRATTPEASIYAGVFEFSHCIGDYEKFFGHSPNPTDENDIAMLTQGYNYGHEGWFRWCSSNGITTWDLGDSKAYQNRINGLGTANHGEKCRAAYKDFVDQYGEGK